MSAQGEVTRLWIFLTPLAQATVAYACRRRLGTPAFLVVAGGAVIQTARSAKSVGFMIVSASKLNSGGQIRPFTEVETGRISFSAVRGAPASHFRPNQCPHRDLDFA